MSGAESYSYRCTQNLLLFYFCLTFLVLVIVLPAKFLSALQSVNTLSSLAENMKCYHWIKHVGYCYSLTTTSDKVNNAVNLLLNFCWKQHLKTTSADVSEYWNAINALKKQQQKSQWCACKSWHTGSVWFPPTAEWHLWMPIFFFFFF